MSVLRSGSQGPHVRKLQLLLNSSLVPSPKLTIDGDFGDRTEQAVRRFQQMRGLPQDGIVGQVTWAALNQTFSVGSKPSRASNHSNCKWMAIAEAELGIHEDSIPGHHNQRIVEYHQATSLRAATDEVPWCSSFVNWVMKQAGYRGSNNALAKSWLEWGLSMDAPREGAVVVIKKKGATSDVTTGSSTGFHVAFFVSSSQAHIRLLGGNQGDEVKYSNFSLKGYDIKGYRWPI
jgi:uncharacterized protein (TIGR02594 family)